MPPRVAEMPKPAIREAGGYLRVEFGYSTVTELTDLYRALAVACIQRQVTRVLIVAGDDEPAGERALRDSATVMVMAGIAGGMRLAFVAASARVAYTYRNVPRDLHAAGIPTQLFGSEEQALRWLDGAAGGARRAA